MPGAEAGVGVGVEVEVVVVVVVVGMARPAARWEVPLPHGAPREDAAGMGYRLSSAAGANRVSRPLCSRRTPFADGVKLAPFTVSPSFE